MNSKEERRVRLYFDISIIGKGAISAAEIIAGVLALFVPVSVLTDFVIRLTQGELIEEPTDFIATHLVQLAHQLALAGGTFIALYLLSRGFIKLFLIIAMLKNKLWAYPSSLALLAAFVLYQCYQIAVSYSIAILLLTLFDLIVMYFIWREYQVLKSHQ